MIDKEIIFTHRGWFLFCPVYLAFESKGNDKGVKVKPRREWLSILIPASVAILQAFYWARTIINKNYDPQWPVIVTGELENKFGSI